MITIVMGGLFGSEGKGSVVSVLAGRFRWDLVIRTGSPNAGHTFKKPDGSLVKMRQLPTTWYYAKHTPVCIPAGAVVSKEVLLAEAHMLRAGGFDAPIYVSPFAAVIDRGAMEQEKMITTGTTREGVGATRARKCLRQATVVRDDPDFCPGHELGQLVDVGTPWADIHNRNKDILIEATQGFGLSLDGGNYPFVTSTNLTVYHILDDAGIPFGVHYIRPILVVRTFPIRIAGNSGPLANEITWGELRKRYGEHIPDEQTTVTKKTRRVGEWDAGLVREAIAATKPVDVVLTFVDYVFPDIKEAGITDEVDSWLKEMESSVGRRFDYLGIGIGELMERNERQILTPTGVLGMASNVIVTGIVD